jgi:hypothetical protein
MCSPRSSARINVRVYPYSGPQSFPEFANPRYNPANRPVGLAFSGGGPRAMSCALGQARYAVGLPSWMEKIGAISCVSGGSWFGSIFSFADAGNYPDSELLGPAIPPGQLYWGANDGSDRHPANVNFLPANRLAFGLTQIDNFYIAGALGLLYEEFDTPYDKLYSRLLGWGLLSGFGLDGDWSTTPARPDRPFFIANGSLVTNLGVNQRLWQFEYTQQYVGTPQSAVPTALSPHQLPAALQARLPARVQSIAPVAGGGWVDVVGFDSTAPQIAATQATVTPPASDWTFRLSDVIGSSGAAPGSYFDMFGYPGILPEFYTWPLRAGTNPAAVCSSIVDGENLENTGIVALLRRQYPVIFAFINTDVVFGDTTYPYGIDPDVSALFGMTTVPPLGQSAQVFSRSDFTSLIQAFREQNYQTGVPWWLSRLDVLPGNPFGIPAYKPVILWLYNGRSISWANALTDPSIRGLATRPQVTGQLPWLRTVFQNPSDIPDVSELLMYKPWQVNLLASMSWWNLSSLGDNVLQDAVGRADV